MVFIKWQSTWLRPVDGNGNLSSMVIKICQVLHCSVCSCMVFAHVKLPSQAVHAWSTSSCACMVHIKLFMHGPYQAVNAWTMSSCACMVLVKQFMHGPSQAVHAWSYSSCSCMVLIKLQIIARLCRVHQKRWSRVGVKIKDGVRCSE